ncbi:Myb-like DNA-binding protein [Phytophthora megakarya]|uniref:Myb-like DNA-binding protein n=1 Tax=Phytophthora megakarya TaxID=4795 RepID=A0A225WNK1_9STRA|nr:Myb-like DNA-binding protein [Phytophthora megakarya]
MTITPRVQSQYFQKDQELIRLAPNQDQARSLPTKRAGTPWTLEEHELFLEALECYPSGPWKTIAAHIGTRTTRQTMTHAQKYREKIARRRKAEAAASPTNKPESEVLVTSDHPRPTFETPQTSNPSMAMSSHMPNPNHAMMHEGEFMDSHGQFVTQEGELELDDSVIALLETFEPLEMMSALEP